MSGEEREVPLAKKPAEVDVRFTRLEQESRRRRRNRSRDDSSSRPLSRSGTPSKSPPIKVWDPVQAENDKIVKKKEREELYHSQNPKEEPILLIKKREIITKYLKPEAEPQTDDGMTKIIKKSDRAKYVDVDYDTAKRKQQELARDDLIETNYIEEQPAFHIEEGKDYTTERTIKIEGTEYLPKGFIELDPILYKDEYMFTSVHDEKNFEEDQRRTKEMRRQQYNNRNFAKVREVIIFKIEYLKRRATQILEKWFETNTQGMNQADIVRHSQELQVDPDTFQKMHDVFIEDKTLFGKQTEELNKLIYKDNQKQESQQKVVRKKTEPSTPTSSRRGKSARKGDKPNSPVVSKSEVVQTQTSQPSAHQRHSKVLKEALNQKHHSQAPVEDTLRTQEGDAWKKALVAIRREKDAERKAEEARILKLKNENEELRVKLAEEYRQAQEEAQIYRRLRQEAEEEASKAEKARREAEQLKERMEIEAALLKAAASNDSHNSEKVEGRYRSDAHYYPNHSEHHVDHTEHTELSKSDESRNLWKDYEPKPEAAESRVIFNQAEQDGPEIDQFNKIPLESNESNIPSPYSGDKDSQKSFDSLEDKKRSNLHEAKEAKSSTVSQTEKAHKVYPSEMKSQADQSKRVQQDSPVNHTTSAQLNAVANLVKKNDKGVRRSAESRSNQASQLETQENQNASSNVKQSSKEASKDSHVFKKAVQALAKDHTANSKQKQEVKQSTQTANAVDSKTVSNHNGTSKSRDAHSKSVVASSDMRSSKDKEEILRSQKTEAQTAERHTDTANRSSAVDRNGTKDVRSSKQQLQTHKDTSNSQEAVARDSRVLDSPHQVKESSVEQRKVSEAAESRKSIHEASSKRSESDRKLVDKTETDTLKQSQTAQATRHGSKQGGTRDTSQKVIDDNYQKTDNDVSEKSNTQSKGIRNSKVEDHTASNQSGVRESTASVKEAEQQKRRDHNSRKSEHKDSQQQQQQHEVSQDTKGQQTREEHKSTVSDRRRVSDRGINKLIEKKLEEAQHNRELSDKKADTAESNKQHSSVQDQSKQQQDVRKSVRDSTDSTKQMRGKDANTDSVEKDKVSDKRNSQVKQSVRQEEDDSYSQAGKQVEKTEDAGRSRSSAFRIEDSQQKATSRSSDSLAKDKNTEERVYTEAEVLQLLKQKEDELEAIHQEQLVQAKASTVEDVIQKKDSVREVCREQLWEKFLLYCEHELPQDEEFQRYLMNQTFLHFLDKHLKGDPNYFNDIEDKCNQLIREDRSED